MGFDDRIAHWLLTGFLCRDTCPDRWFQTHNMGQKAHVSNIRTRSSSKIGWVFLSPISSFSTRNVGRVKPCIVVLGWRPDLTNKILGFFSNDQGAVLTTGYVGVSGRLLAWQCQICTSSKLTSTPLLMCLHYYRLVQTSCRHAMHSGSTHSFTPAMHAGLHEMTRTHSSMSASLFSLRQSCSDSVPGVVQ